MSVLMLVQVRVQRVLVASKRCSEDNTVLEIVLLIETILEWATARTQAEIGRAHV